MMDVVPVLFCFFLFCLWPLQLLATGAQQLLCLLCNIISKVRYLIIPFLIFLEKGKYFDFNQSLWCLPYSLHHPWISQSSLSFGLLISYVCSSMKDASNFTYLSTQQKFEVSYSGAFVQNQYGQVGIQLPEQIKTLQKAIIKDSIRYLYVQNVPVVISLQPCSYSNDLSK